VKYFITGHTGFKGAWLGALLAEAGQDLYGLSLDPEPGSLFETAAIGSMFAGDFRGDVRDERATRALIARTEPDVILHLAAQSLVRDSYERPRWTIETNVMGSLSVLEAASATPTVGALVMVTTDKVYRNVGQVHGYVESDALGGHDPYSASKAMADILVTSWVSSFGGPPTGIARAGNVIGGGDVSKDRLMPDLLRSFQSNSPALLRYPQAVRPWQHVLDCLSGYVLLADTLKDGGGVGSWNFGPPAESLRTVSEVADLAASIWGSEASWSVEAGSHPHEADLLTLDASRAREELSWKDRLSFEQTVGWTVEWSKRVASGESPLAVTLKQISAFHEFSA
jgi:CDP-glucose 4,6-dehydratase